MFASVALKILSSLLVLALWGLTVTVVANQTFLSSKYVEGQLEATHSYDRFSDALVNEVSQTPDLAAYPDAKTKLESILTPAMVKAKINTALVQMEAYSRGEGPAPTVDLSDLATQAQAAGLPIGQDGSLNKPITLGGQGENQIPKQTLDTLRTGSIISGVLLTAGVLLLSWRTRRYTALPTVLIVVGVLVGVFGAFLYVSPGVIHSAVHFDDASNAFATLGHDLVGVMVRDVGKRLGLIAALYLVVGIVARVVVSRLKLSPSSKQNPAKARL